MLPNPIRISVLDLQKNIVIGCSLPFSAPGVFNVTYSTKDQAKSNLINLLLTSTGERMYLPDFGCDLKHILFEGMTEQTAAMVQNEIATKVEMYVPAIQVQSATILLDTDSNTISVTVTYALRLSGQQDQITISFI